MFKYLIPFVALLTGIASAQNSRFTAAGVLGISGTNWEQGGVTGVEILEVSREGSAGLAGLHTGDVITDVNGKHASSIQELASILAEIDPGTKVSIGYLIRSNLGWMPKEALIILAKKDYEPRPTDSSPATEQTTVARVPTRSTNTGQDSPSLTIRIQKRLTNQNVLEMTRSKLSDLTVAKAIQANDADFDLSTPALLKLKTAGVSDSVIRAMFAAVYGKKATTPESAPPETPTTPVIPDNLPSEVGVFVRQKGELLEMEPEVVNWRSGGVLKSMVTVGLDKGHVNGTIPGPHSPLTISWAGLGLAGPLEFYIRCQEGNSASEYQLMRLWDKGNRREFRSVTGGILHKSGGAQLNVMAFKFDKVAPRTYKIQLSDLQPGEYGFLAPGAVSSSNAASLGRIYTFRIPE
jgi:hypothetical protein